MEQTASEESLYESSLQLNVTILTAFPTEEVVQLTQTVDLSPTPHQQRLAPSVGGCALFTLQKIKGKDLQAPMKVQPSVELLVNYNTMLIM